MSPESPQPLKDALEHYPAWLQKAIGRTILFAIALLYGVVTIAAFFAVVGSYFGSIFLLIWSLSFPPLFIWLSPSLVYLLVKKDVPSLNLFLWPIFVIGGLVYWLLEQMDEPVSEYGAKPFASLPIRTILVPFTCAAWLIGVLVQTGEAWAQRRSRNRATRRLAKHLSAIIADERAAQIRNACPSAQPDTTTPSRQRIPGRQTT